MTRIVDPQAAESAGCEFRHDTDHGPVYGSQAVTFPRGWDQMDPHRHVAPCVPTIHAQKLIGSSVSRWKATCADCGMVRHGWSKSEAKEAVEAAHG